MPKQEAVKFDWGYTRAAEEALGDTYLGRRLIGRDADVRGGIYFGTYRGEAIVIDPEKYPEEYERYYQEAAELADLGNGVDPSLVLSAVFTTVESNMSYSQEGVERTLKDIASDEGKTSLPDGTKVELSAFMQEGVGVCRHQALTCAALLERFKDEDHIRGDISVDRNQRWSPREEERGGHAWTRYTAHSGIVYIMDVAQGYFGRLENTDADAQWNYMRPEEQEASRAQDICVQDLGKISINA